MIKEIEINNSTEVLEDGLALSYETTPEIITAVLTGNGATLTAMVNRYLKAGCSRKVALYYMLPKYEQQMVAEYLLGTFGPSNTVNQNTQYAFDLSPVLTQIIHTAPEQLADDTIYIRLYTYEANTSFNYGTCYPAYSPIVQYVTGDYCQYGGRLWQCKTTSIGNLPTNPNYFNPSGVPSSGTMTFNVPYTVSYPGSSISPASTDGWYTLRVLDVENWLVGAQYVPGDIVLYLGALYTCTVAALGQLPSALTHYALMTTEEEYNLYEFGYGAYDTVPTILNSNMLLTRYVKQKHIYELLLKTNYKRYDDITVVNQLEKIYAMREAAVVHLNDGNPIRARYTLDMITNEVNSFTSNNGEKRVVEMITNFTI
jgi:hypothetical protein